MNKIHERLFQALGPLSAAWLEMQKGMQDDLEEGSETNPELVLEHLNNTIVLIGQTINKLSYERRLAILGTLIDIKSAKSQLKDHADDMLTSYRVKQNISLGQSSKNTKRQKNYFPKWVNHQE